VPHAVPLQLACSKAQAWSVRGRHTPELASFALPSQAAIAGPSRALTAHATML